MARVFAGSCICCIHHFKNVLVDYFIYLAQSTHTVCYETKQKDYAAINLLVEGIIQQITQLPSWHLLLYKIMLKATFQQVEALRTSSHCEWRGLEQPSLNPESGFKKLYRSCTKLYRSTWCIFPHHSTDWRSYTSGSPSHASVKGTIPSWRWQPFTEQIHNYRFLA